jgi:lipoate-protein ligase A
MMEISEEDRKLIERLTPMLEDSLKYKIVRSLIDALEETSYPPEEMIQEDFIRDIKEAEKEIKEGKCERYSIAAFKEKFPV